jgi:hypothetical protein
LYCVKKVKLCLQISALTGKKHTLEEFAGVYSGWRMEQ